MSGVVEERKEKEAELPKVMSFSVPHDSLSALRLLRNAETNDAIQPPSIFITLDVDKLAFSHRLFVHSTRIRSPFLFPQSSHCLAAVYPNPPHLRSSFHHISLNMSQSQKPVLISGAGLASLLLAQSLHNSHIPFRIFERDESLASRGQGYRLRLSSEGLDAIESVLTPSHWQKFWDTCGKTGGQGFSLLSAITGEPLEKKEGPPAGGEKGDGGDDDTKPGAAGGEGGGAAGAQQEGAGGKPEGRPGGGESLGSRDGKIVGIARGEMRNVFMEGIEEHISWQKNVHGYEKTKDGVRAIFADGSKSDEGCLLVGGEGINSHVARQLSDGQLKVYDLGARGIHGQAPTTAFKELGEGVFAIRDPDAGLSIITNVRSKDMDDPNIQFGFTMIGHPGVIKAPNDNYAIVGKTAADIAKNLTAGWHEKFKPLFDNMVESEAAFWKITCSTPTGVPEWTNDPRVTVIGDAAHSMTPAGGIGANTAVRDSALLGRLLAEAGGCKDGVTAAYEKEMRVYASEAVAKSFGQASGQFNVKIDEDTPTVNSRN